MTFQISLNYYTPLTSIEARLEEYKPYGLADRPQNYFPSIS